jgi:hypothetical protein
MRAMKPWLVVVAVLALIVLAALLVAGTYEPCCA